MGSGGSTTKGGPTRKVAAEPLKKKQWWEADLPTTVVVRAEVRSMPAEDQRRFGEAAMKMRENKNGTPGTSEYFRLAVMHGGLRELSRSAFPTYCVHGREAFPAWHRAYLVEFETALRRADVALGRDGNIALPYWDWSSLDSPEVVPNIIRETLMQEFEPDFFPKEMASSRNRYSMRINGDAEVKQRLLASRVPELADMCLKSTMHAQHACTTYSSARNPSLESPHNNVHVSVGGMMGAMHSSFHPIFWLHHCNVDRLYEAYIALEPDSATEFEEHQRSLEGGVPTAAGFPDGPWGFFEPFKRGAENFHARDAFVVEDLGFRYDALPKPSAPAMRESMPFYAVFQGIDIKKLKSSCTLHVHVVTEGFEEAAAAGIPDAHITKPSYAGSCGIFFLAGANCPNCEQRPLYEEYVDITATMRRLKLGPEKAVLKALVEWAPDDEGQVVIEELKKGTLLPPEIRGPRTTEEEQGPRALLKRGLLDDTSVDDEAPARLLKLAEGTVTFVVKAIPTTLDRLRTLEAVDAALAQWSNATGLVFLRHQNEAASANLTFKWRDRTGENEFFFDGPGGALARATASEVVFDASEYWEVDDLPHPRRSRDADGRVNYAEDENEEDVFEQFFQLTPVLLHEIGHVLGLGHSDDPADVMSPYYLPGRNELTENDIARVKKLYPKEA